MLRPRPLRRCFFVTSCAAQALSYSGWLLCGEVVAGHLGCVADEQAIVGDGGDVPGLAFEGGEAGDFRELVGSGAHEHEFSAFGDDDEVVAGEQELAVAVAPALPLALACLHVDAGEDAFVQPVDVAVVQDGAIELVLHRVVFPDGARRQALARRV